MKIAIIIFLLMLMSISGIIIPGPTVEAQEDYGTLRWVNHDPPVFIDDDYTINTISPGEITLSADIYYNLVSTSVATLRFYALAKIGSSGATEDLGYAETIVSQGNGTVHLSISCTIPNEATLVWIWAKMFSTGSSSRAETTLLGYNVAGTALRVIANVDGIVADGVSSAKITVELPTAESEQVTLTDGKTTLTETAVNGEAVFTYVPDTEKFGLSPSNIPPEGVDITLTATSDGKSGITTLKVYRKPILLVHGVWSSSKTWDKMKQRLENNGFTVYTIDYPNVDESLMDVATVHLAGRISSLKKEFSQEHNANITKIDVITHSMGGLAARYYINEFKGKADVDIQTLIMIGTPHLGSPWPKIYFDWMTSGEFGFGPLGTLPRWFPEGWMGKYGCALDELVPGSSFLTLLNSQPNNPNVDYYTICGTNNWLSTWYGITLYERGLIDKITTEEYYIDGDGIVELASQRYAKKMPKGFYVDEAHLSETGSYPLFQIASNILKGLEYQIPSVYKSPAKPTLKVRGFHSSTDLLGERFKLVRGPAIMKFTVDPQIWGIKLGEGNEIKDFPQLIAIRYTYDTVLYREDDVAMAVFDVVKNNEVVGTLFMRVRPKSSWAWWPPFAYVRVINPTTFFVYNHNCDTIEIHFNYKGPLNVLTESGLVTSPDPAFTISVDENNNTKIVLLEGNVMIFDNYNGTAILEEGQTVILHPDSPMDTPTTFDLSTIDKWWATIKVCDHVLCKKVDSDGNPVKVTTIFTTDDMVYSWLSLANASEGDEVYWLFQGPNNLTEESPYTIDWSGEGLCYAWLNLSEYGEQAIGSWNVTAYINGEMASIAYFDVERASTDTPGFEIMLLIGAIVVALIVIKRRKI